MRADTSFGDVLRDRPSAEARVPPSSTAVLSTVPIAVKYVVRRSPDAPDVLALAGVDPSLASDGHAAIDALGDVLVSLAEEAGPRTSEALRALLDLGHRLTTS